MILASLLAFVSLAPATAAPLIAPCAADDDATRRVADDIRFAENLSRARYFRLADEVLQEIRKEKLSDELTGEVALAEARLRKRAAELSNDDTKRLEWLTRGVDLLFDWGQDGSSWIYHPRRPEALEDLAALLQARGKLRAQMRGAESDPARAEALRSLAEADFQQAEVTLTTLDREYMSRAGQAESDEKSDLAAQLKDRAGFSKFQRGLNSLEWAEVSKERELRLDKALTAFDDYLWSLEEERLSQYFALHYVGIVNHRLGNFDEALSIQSDVLTQARYYWDDYRGDPTQDGYITDLFDRTWYAQAQAHLAKDALDAAMASMDTLLAEHERGQRSISRTGYQALLDWAETLQSLGRGARAAELVKLVADQAASFPEGQRANDLLASLASEGTLEGSASTYIAAAKGLIEQQKFADAAFQYLRAAGSLRDAGERETYALEAWMGAGRAYRQQRRYLEAGLAFERALATATELKAPIEAVGAAASGLSDAFDKRYKETRDPFDKALRDEASSRLSALGVVGDLPFTQAKEKFDVATLSQPPDLALLAEAREQFAGVAETASVYERALVLVARCLAAEGRPTEALAQFDVLLKRAADPKFTPAGVEGRDKREGALAEALNYKATLLLDPAVKRPAEALTLLAGFEVKLPRQPTFIESVKALRARAYIQLKDAAKAEEAFADLREYKADGAMSRIVAFELAQFLSAQAAEAETAGDLPRSRDLLSRAADALWANNELSAFASYSNLMGNADWYARAGRHDRATVAYQKALDVFARPGSGVDAARLDQTRLGLATSWNELKEFGRARPLWLDLKTRNPTNLTMLRGAARGFGGWLELQPDGSVTEIAGSGDFDEAQELWSTIFQSARPLEPQKLYWESKLGIIYAYYREGAARPELLKDARIVLADLLVLKPDLDEQTSQELPPEQRYAPPLKPLFKYLDRKLPAAGAAPASSR
ncbi:MAG: hypothetical protein ACT4PU_13365 [Planctomycetota bacterium]